tara:strand:- start:4147 stop:4320 length:174 start_codon:yes stop_codon:yes gene_type:complete
MKRSHLDLAKEDLKAIENHVKTCQMYEFDIMPDVVLNYLESAVTALNIHEEGKNDKR